MRDQDKTKKQLVKELAEMRQRVATLEALETKHQGADNELRQAAAELESCYEEMEAFARSLSHDLRGALGLIISFVQVLKEYHAALTGEELHRYLDMIARKGHKAVQVIDGLLEGRIARPPGGDIEIGPLDMASVIISALEIVSYMIEEHQAEIILPPSWPVALGYAPWVEEVWGNYLSNAIKYGGRPPCVELGATEQADGTVRFWIRDNGDGLASEDQARLFTPFVRHDLDPEAGYGLGLVIVRRIVERLGGQVGVESEGVPNQGSLFFFTLPAA